MATQHTPDVSLPLSHLSRERALHIQPLQYNRIELQAEKYTRRMCGVREITDFVTSASLRGLINPMHQPHELIAILENDHKLEPCRISDQK